jgi:hypothetical protein
MNQDVKQWTREEITTIAKEHSIMIKRKRKQSQPTIRPDTDG